MKQLTLGDRHKAYERLMETQVDLTKAVGIRLDGRAFHTFTKGFDRPFDVRLHNAMVATCEDLLSEFPGCAMAYTQSDEITLIFLVKLMMDGTRRVDLPFNGRVQKLVSVAASRASLSFNFYLMPTLSDEMCAEKQNCAVFDARIFQFHPSPEYSVTPEQQCGNVEAWNNLLWRYQDGLRNSKAALAQAHFPAKELFGLRSEEMLTKLKEDKQVIWSEMDDWKKYGTFVWKDHSRSIQRCHDMQVARSFMNTCDVAREQAAEQSIATNPDAPVVSTETISEHKQMTTVQTTTSGQNKPPFKDSERWLSEFHERYSNGMLPVYSYASECEDRMARTMVQLAIQMALKMSIYSSYPPKQGTSLCLECTKIVQSSDIFKHEVIERILSDWGITVSYTPFSYDLTCQHPQYHIDFKSEAGPIQPAQQA